VQGQNSNFSTFKETLACQQTTFMEELRRRNACVSAENAIGCCGGGIKCKARGKVRVSQVSNAAGKRKGLMGQEAKSARLAAQQSVCTLLPTASDPCTQFYQACSTFGTAVARC
jgi:hypothetical protein